MSADYLEFKEAVERLANRFENDAAFMRSASYDEATLRLEFLDPMFAALGWNVWNNPPQPLHLRDVVVENRVARGSNASKGGAGKADYVFRTSGLDRWVCEAKRPFDNLDRNFFQVQNYTYNMRLWLGALCNFEELIVFVVGAAPSKERPFSPVPGWRLNYRQYGQHAEQIWDLLSKPAVEDGAIERFIQSLGKVRGKARQGWLIKPDRTKTVDAKFLSFLEAQRARFAKDIVQGNPQIDWDSVAPGRALQQIFDRVLFQRVSEDRNIDVGVPLQQTLLNWEGRGRIKGQLWPSLAANFRHLSATFNGGVFGKDPRNPPFADGLNVSDQLLADFVEEIAGDESEWLFGTMPLWLIGSVYERFLGSEIDSLGDVHLKPEARKAGGVYYTPESVVRQVVDLTIGKLLPGKSPSEVLKLKIIDPSCGSGSFLLLVFDRMLDHCLDWFENNRSSCAAEDVFEQDGKLYLTTAFKRKLCRSCIFGVDIDPIAVQVAKMSLCLRVLEDENQEALVREATLFPKQTFLPDLDENVICANSLLPLSAYPQQLSADRVSSDNPVDWGALLSKTHKGRGFDAVVGNPPWGADIDAEVEDFVRREHREVLVRMPDTYIYFTHLSIRTLMRDGAYLGMVLPGTLLNQTDAAALRRYLLEEGLEAVADLGEGIFGDALNTTSIIVGRKGGTDQTHIKLNSVRDLSKELKDIRLGNWTDTNRAEWESVVSSDNQSTFYTSSLKELAQLIHARRSFGTLENLIDHLGIQRGVTPDYLQAHMLSEEDAAARKIEDTVLRNSLRGEDIERFGRALSTRKIIYTTSESKAEDIPNAIAALEPYRKHITCTEVRRGTHPWWRLHRPRSKEIFERKKFIGLTTTRRVELVWDDEENLVVTDAMYVFAPRSGVPWQYLMGVMHSDAFHRLHVISNQGDARVIPQIKASKLKDIPVPDWDANNDIHKAIVSSVELLMNLNKSDEFGLSQNFLSAFKNLNVSCEAAYGFSSVGSNPSGDA